MKSKAFTLIELLAVIIILAIVALIATPIILDVVDDARISAGRSEANMILSGINNYCASEDMKYQLDNSYERICTSSMNADNVKDMVNLGNAEIKEIAYDGEKLTTLVIESNNHIFTLCSSGIFVMDDEICQRNSNSLIAKLLKQYREGNEVGLVKDSVNPNLYYYTGTNEEVANNFLWYGGHQWRVIEFDTDENTLTLITQQPLTSINPADKIWTSDQLYESSYINSWLNDYFWNNLDSGIQNNILDSNFNVGIYSDVDEIITTKKVGLLDSVQYERAGGAGSFLDIKDFYWLGNRYDSSSIQYINVSGGFGNESITGTCGVRAVVKINDLVIDFGEGTIMSSFMTEDVKRYIDDVQIGEYINVPYSGSDNACGSDNMCTFRVIGKDNDSVKVILNGLLPVTSSYGNSSIISTSHTIYTLLYTFADGISETYRYTGNKTFYIGDYPSSSANYKDIQDETLEASIGLPTLGEILSGNDIDLNVSESKVFVDVNTIENPTVSDYYWIMNRYSLTEVRRNNYNGTIGYSDFAAERGVRPVMFLKRNLNFISGFGTAQQPYELQ